MSHECLLFAPLLTAAAKRLLHDAQLSADHCGPGSGLMAAHVACVQQEGCVHTGYGDSAGTSSFVTRQGM